MNKISNAVFAAAKNSPDKSNKKTEEELINIIVKQLIRHLR